MHIYKLIDTKAKVSDLVDEFFLFMYADDWKGLRSFDTALAPLNTWISTVSFRFFRDYKQSITISDKWETFRGD